MIITVKPDGLLQATTIYNRNGKSTLIAMFGADETLINNTLAVYVLFEDKEEKDIKTIRVEFDPNGDLTFPSLTPTFPAAAWYEREIYDMFGLKPEGHPDLRPLVLHESFPPDYHPLLKKVDGTKEVRGERSYEMSTAKGEGLFEVAVGPIHAGIIEPGHFRFSQAGEAMLQLDAKLFYTHRGIEKMAEGKTIDEALFLVERVCGACSVANTLSYCQALEKLADQKVSKRAWLIRMLLSEVERLYNHVGDTGNLCAGVGFSPIISMGTFLKEKIMQCNERLAGNRFLRGVIVPGGVRQDVSEEALAFLNKTLDEVEKKYAVIVDLLANHGDFINRIKGTGIVKNQTAIDLAMVGVGARASGVKCDCRKDLPYGFYEELQFDVPVEHTGDVQARLIIREKEVVETIKLIRQILAMLPDTKGDELCYKNAQYRNLEGSWGISESARGNNIHWVMLDEEGKITRLFIRSASYPNWPALTIAVQGDIIPDFPLINKSFELCYACLDR